MAIHMIVGLISDVGEPAKNVGLPTVGEPVKMENGVVSDVGDPAKIDPVVEDVGEPSKIDEGKENVGEPPKNVDALRNELRVRICVGDPEKVEPISVGVIVVVAAVVVAVVVAARRVIWTVGA